MLVLFEKKKLMDFFFYVNTDLGKLEKKFCVCLPFHKHVTIIKFTSGLTLIIFTSASCDFSQVEVT